MEIMHRSNNSSRKEPLFILAVAAVVLSMAMPARSETLQGSVSKSGSMSRLSRPQSSRPAGNFDGAPALAPPRLARVSSNLGSGSGLVDPGAFQSPLAGQVNRYEARLGVVRPEEFNLPRGFELGEERGSRELTLAWELWHKQFSRAIYERWSAVADEPGRATVRVTVTRDRQVTAVISDSNGSRRFDRKLEGAIEAMSGNPGLTFPAKSRRSVVTFEADYLAARNVTPGYTWVKDDFEKVKESY